METRRTSISFSSTSHSYKSSFRAELYISVFTTCEPPLKVYQATKSLTPFHHSESSLRLNLFSLQPSDMSNPRVFFDITINGNNAGRIIFELFADVVPKTVRSLSLFPLSLNPAAKLSLHSMRWIGWELSSTLYRWERSRTIRSSPSLQRFEIPPNHQEFHVSRRRFHSWKRNWWRIYLRREIRGWEVSIFSPSDFWDSCYKKLTAFSFVEQLWTQAREAFPVIDG